MIAKDIVMTKKRIFITGAAGFIGFHMARYLHERGDSVVGYDNFNSYYDPNLKRSRATALAKQGINVLEGDLKDSQALREAVEQHQTTHLLHLAARHMRIALCRSNRTVSQYLLNQTQGCAFIKQVCRARVS